MIVDFQRFLESERPYWLELEGLLDTLQDDHWAALDLRRARRLHYLYERASVDLVKLADFSVEFELRVYLESLVARAYGEVHETRRRRSGFRFLPWFAGVFPRTFRRHRRAFALAAAVCLAGCLFGGGAILVDPVAKAAIIPFDHLAQTPAQRVAQEETPTAGDPLAGRKSAFSAYLIRNNTRVSFLTLALGMTYGLGTMVVLFYNGVILGAVATEYVDAGQTAFLLGWLLPHGVIEIPAVLLAGQAGLVLAHALIGWRVPIPLTGRLRRIVPDVATLTGGVCVLLVWAGIVEAFFSQYHEPVMPYAAKIGFGLLELAGLAIFLGFAGRQGEPAKGIADGT